MYNLRIILRQSGNDINFMTTRLAWNDPTCERCWKEKTKSPVGQQEHFGQHRA